MFQVFFRVAVTDSEDDFATIKTFRHRGGYSHVEALAQAWVNRHFPMSGMRFTYVRLYPRPSDFTKAVPVQ